MYKFHSIGQLYHTIRYARDSLATDVRECPSIKGPITFVGTTKIHGSNVSVVMQPGGGITFQSRNREITRDLDNHGFVQWIYDDNDRLPAIMSLRSQLDVSADETVVLYGEWCGSGIQTGVAVNRLPSRQWVLFAAHAISSSEIRSLNIESLVTPTALDVHNVYSAGVWNITIDFSDETSMSAAIDAIQSWTEAVDRKCPWASMWNIDGTGEGIVWCPVDASNSKNLNLHFKTKGETHKVVNHPITSKSTSEILILETAENFVNYSMTDARLMQGIEWLREMNHPIKMESMKHYLTWLNKDIIKECSQELKDSGLTWKHIAKFVNKKALNFFKQFLMKL